METTALIAAVVGGLVGALIGYLVVIKLLAPRAVERALSSAREEIEQAKKQAQSILSEAQNKARKEAGEIVRQAEKEARQRRSEITQELRQRERDLRERQKQVARMEEKLGERFDQLDKRQRELDEQRRRLAAQQEEVEKLRQELKQELERISGLSRDQARQELMAQVEREAEYEAAQLHKRIIEEAEEKAAQEARRIMVTAMWRTSVDHYADAMVSTVDLPDDKMKGRVIGKEGRNIRTLERVTGCDVIVDETPGVVTISSFDPVRRETCRLALERLIADGRIHPARIEETVAQVQEEMEQIIWEAGQEALFATGISGVHPELVKLLGKLKFRTSYGQNVLKHSIEVAFLSAAIAAELGIDPTNAKRGGLLHDIGKAVDAEMEGPHQFIGMELAQKYGENEVVCNVIGAHHGDIDQTLEAAIVQVADSISASRPGARGESLEHYIKRLTKLEEIGREFAGVEKCYAIQAGRELRVMVKPEQVDDVLAHNLARKLAKRIEQELQYPGVIKVTVVREVREIEYAK